MEKKEDESLEAGSQKVVPRFELGLPEIDDIIPHQRFSKSKSGVITTTLHNLIFIILPCVNSFIISQKRRLSQLSSSPGSRARGAAHGNQANLAHRARLKQAKHRLFTIPTDNHRQHHQRCPIDKFLK